MSADLPAATPDALWLRLHTACTTLGLAFDDTTGGALDALVGEVRRLRTGIAVAVLDRDDAQALSDQVHNMLDEARAEVQRLQHPTPPPGTHRDWRAEILAITEDAMRQPDGPNEAGIWISDLAPDLLADAIVAALRLHDHDQDSDGPIPSMQALAASQMQDERDAALAEARQAQMSASRLGEHLSEIGPALHKARDEAARLTSERDEARRVLGILADATDHSAAITAIADEWPFMVEVNRCTCYGGNTIYGHEPGCGLEPGPAWWVIDALRNAAQAADVTADRDRLRAGIERIAKHALGLRLMDEDGPWYPSDELRALLNPTPATEETKP